MEECVEEQIREGAPPLRWLGCVGLSNDITKADPAERSRAITHALREPCFSEAISEALVVLPEAIDLKCYYANRPEPVLTMDDLQRLAEELRVAFIAGLSEPEGRGSGTFYNSAFLIDPWKPPCRLSRKIAPDPKARWYRAFSGATNADRIRYRGMTLAVLICEDAAGRKDDYTCDAIRKSQSHIFARLKASVNPTLCVPARMDTYYPQAVATDWEPEINVIVANLGGPQRLGGIRLAGKEWSVGSENRLMLWRL